MVDDAYPQYVSSWVQLVAEFVVKPICLSMLLVSLSARKKQMGNIVWSHAFSKMFVNVTTLKSNIEKVCNKMNVQRSHTPISLLVFLRDWGAYDKRWRMGLGALIVLLPLMTTVIAFSITARSARANVTANSDDPLQTGWHPDQPGLTPGIVSGGTFGKLFSTAVNGQIYAQPLVLTRDSICGNRDKQRLWP